MKDVSRDLTLKITEREDPLLVYLITVRDMHFVANYDRVVTYMPNYRTTSTNFNPVKVDIGAVEMGRDDFSSGIEMLFHDVSIPTDLSVNMIVGTNVYISTVSTDLIDVLGHEHTELFKISSAHATNENITLRLVYPIDLYDYTVPTELITYDEFPYIPRDAIYV